jgi:hypothetical protein
MARCRHSSVELRYQLDSLLIYRIAPASEGLAGQEVEGSSLSR